MESSRISVFQVDVPLSHGGYRLAKGTPASVANTTVVRGSRPARFSERLTKQC